jgi:hypothetical protein
VYLLLAATALVHPGSTTGNSSNGASMSRASVRNHGSPSTRMMLAGIRVLLDVFLCLLLCPTWALIKSPKTQVLN